MSDEKPIMGHMELPIFAEVIDGDFVAVSPEGVHVLMVALNSPEFCDRARAIMSSGEAPAMRCAKLNALIVEVVFVIGLGSVRGSMEGADA